MSVPSFEFLGFVAIVAVILAISAAPTWRRAVLFAANVAFFITFAQGAASLVPFVLFLAAGYLAMRIVEKYKGRLAFAAIVVLLVVAFCCLKRYAFAPAALYLPEAFVVIGLSYAFFRVLALVVDAYQDVLPAPVGPVAFVNYTLNFTSFVSGPIQLYKPFRRNEIEAPAPLNAAVVGRALERIVTGFVKVTILSPLFAWAQQRCVELAGTSAAPGARAADAALMLALFPIFLYINFSGYTDVVIGAARFLRLELPENFSKPFTSRGFLEFWNRWHMSLSNWFKTYVYSPLLLGLMRRFPSRTTEPVLGVIAYFVTFFLVGIWHGQTLMFVILGLLFGLGVSGNKLYQLLMVGRLGRARYQTLCANPFYAAVSTGLTFLWLAFSLLFMWAGQGEIVHFAQTLGTAAIAASLLAILLSASGASLVFTWAGQTAAPMYGTRIWASARVLRPAWYAALAVVVVSVAVILNAPAPHIVYKAF